MLTWIHVGSIPGQSCFSSFADMIEYSSFTLSTNRNAYPTKNNITTPNNICTWRFSNVIWFRICSWKWWDCVWMPLKHKMQKLNLDKLYLEWNYFFVKYHIRFRPTQWLCLPSSFNQMRVYKVIQDDERSYRENSSDNEMGYVDVI